MRYKKSLSKRSWIYILLFVLCVFAITNIIQVEKPIEKSEIEEVVLPEEPEPQEKAIYEMTEREQIDFFILEVSEKYEIEPSLIHSVVWHESQYTPKAKTGNCLGLMQVSTDWHLKRAEKLGVSDFYDIRGNLLLGVDYLTELYKNYGDMTYALMLYNMHHDVAHQMYKEGRISGYAQSVLERAEKIKQGVI